MTRRERAYNKKIEELIKRVGRLEDEEVERVLKILAATRTELGAAVAQTKWEAHYLPQAKEAVERAMRGFEQQYRAAQGEALGTSWNLGIDLVDAPLAAAGIRLAAPEIARTVLEVLQGYSSDLISGLSADALKRLNNELTMGVLGQKPQYEVMKAIDKLLGIETNAGISWRAETITRTEMARVQSAAREARMRAAVEAQTDPAVKFRKKWIASGKLHPRPNHAALNGKVVDLDEEFAPGLPSPHAPGLPAEECVNCGCVHVLVVADLEKLPKEWDPMAYQLRAA